MKQIKGISLTILIAITSILLSRFIPIGAVTLGIVLGVLIGNIFSLNPSFSSGIRFSEKNILSLAIILMGVNLNFGIIQELGFASILIIVLSIGFTIFAAIILSKILKLDPKLGLLLGIGNGICGSSAIAATEQIIGADKDDVGLSVTIVNFLGTIGIFMLPFVLKIILNFSDIHSAFLIGDTLQAIGQVVASGFSINEEVGHAATLIKMMRILMLTPVVLILIMVFHKSRKNIQPNSVQKQSFPFFIIGFILMSIVASFQLLPESWIHIIGKTSHYFLVIAMAGIGLKVSFLNILKNGKKALLVGSLVFLFQILFAIILIKMFL
jgi:uncharacterized integral membrane protein (TIGR00698 family)